MRILLGSHAFHPAVGGIESSSMSLAREFVRAGHHVTVITQTADSRDDVSFPFEVLRAPGPIATYLAVKQHDVFLQNNLSMRTAWPLVVLRRPWVVAVATWIARADGSLSGRDRLKRRVLRRACVVAVSEFVASRLEMPSEVIHNAYDDETFYERDDVERAADVVFVGRLVSDKGVDLAIEAIGLLEQRGRPTALTVIGEGPELPALEELARDAGVSYLVRFVGVRQHDVLAEELNAHHVMVVPSRWEEPFGIVALEGLASGCEVVVASSGGLPEAAGPTAGVFSSGSAADLAAQLEHALDRQVSGGTQDESRSLHLSRHQPSVVADRYLRLLEAPRGRRSAAKRATRTPG